MELTQAFLDVNIAAVAIAAVVQFILGWAWYSPMMFAEPWMEDSGFKPGDIKQDGASMAKRFGLTIILFFLATWTLAAILGPAPELSAAVNWSLAIGLLLVTALMGINAVYDNRGPRLLWINAGYYVVALLIGGLILGLWH